MKYTIDKQEKYSLLRLHEEKLDSSVAPGSEIRIDNPACGRNKEHCFGYGRSKIH